MFTQPCFIRKNTSDIRNKLKYLGYKCNNGKWMGTYLATFKRDNDHDLFYCGTPKYDLPNNPSLENSIFCGTNEDLFLALAALRDDTDKNQWFVYDDKDDNPDERQIFWFICEENKIEDDMWHDQAYLDCHKATVQELIQHFKDK